VRKPSKTEHQQKFADIQNVHSSTGGYEKRSQKLLALTFIDTLLSSQRTHAQASTHNFFEGASAGQLFQPSADNSTEASSGGESLTR
ncbi:hypothetical protein, partial [Nocardia asteroides]|uniref:hypothetical protein n=1 Tax=Nocardia asteroides TaxID=1824 RepID=UPI0033F9467C